MTGQEQWVYVNVKGEEVRLTFIYFFSSSLYIKVENKTYFNTSYFLGD